jgi:EAL domain-containing protein (putative c-di-GMP-specific phosphodiesterase class I)
MEKKNSSLYEQGSSSKITIADQQQIHHFFQKLTPSSYPNISIPNALSNSILSMQSHDLIEKLRTDHIQTLSQPIVTLPQRRLAYLKCDSFFKENEILFSPDFSDLPSDLKYSLSMGRFYKTLQSISQQQDKFDHQTFIIPLSSDLITNRYTFEDIFALISQNKILSQSVILKIKLPTTQKDIDELLPPLFRIERQGMRLGLQLSHFQLQTYSQQNLSYFQFIELSLKDILSWQAETTRRHVLDILELFCQTVPKTILTDIDHPQILYELFPLTFDYGCGKAFGSYRDLKMLASR